MKKYIFSFLTLACAALMFSTANGQTTTRNVSGYTGIECNGPFNVTVKIDGTESLKMDVDADMEKDIITEVEHGVLKVELKDGWRNRNNNKRANIYISAKRLSYLGNGGSGNTVLAAGNVTGEQARIAVSGSGNLKATVNAESLKIGVSGSGSADLKGKINSATIGVSGSGEVNGKQLTAETVEASISGSGNVDIIANTAVSARISGSGSLQYTGNAKIVSERHSGSGRITKND
jgi:hypothetical protein